MAQLATRRPLGLGEQITRDPSTQPETGTGSRPLRLLVLLTVVSTPLLIPPFLGNSVPVDVVNVVVLLVGGATLYRSTDPAKAPLLASYSLVMAGGLIALTQSIAPTESATIIIQDAYLFLWFLVAVNLIAREGPRFLGTVASAWTVASVAAALTVLIPKLLFPAKTALFGYPLIDLYGRAFGVFRDPNMAGNYLAISFFVMWASPWPRSAIAKALLSLLVVGGIYSTDSISALVILVAAALISLVVAFVSSRQAAAVSILVMGGLALGALAALPPDAGRLADEAGDDLGETSTFEASLGRKEKSLDLRLARWEESLQLFSGDVLIGIGPGTTDIRLSENSDFLTRLGAPIRGELHNDYLAGFLERGLIGGIGVLLIFASMTMVSLRLASSSQLRRAGWRPAALAGAMVAVIMAALSLETLHFRHVWLLFALLAAAHMIVVNQPAEALAPTPRAHDRALRSPLYRG